METTTHSCGNPKNTSRNMRKRRRKQSEKSKEILPKIIFLYLALAVRKNSLQRVTLFHRHSATHTPKHTHTIYLHRESKTINHFSCSTLTENENCVLFSNLTFGRFMDGSHTQTRIKKTAQKRRVNQWYAALSARVDKPTKITALYVRFVETFVCNVESENIVYRICVYTTYASSTTIGIHAKFMLFNEQHIDKAMALCYGYGRARANPI